MPCRRHTTGVHAPASASRKIPIICSSLNRLPFICPSPFSDGLYLQTVGREGGTPHHPERLAQASVSERNCRTAGEALLARLSQPRRNANIARDRASAAKACRVSEFRDQTCGS